MKPTHFLKAALATAVISGLSAPVLADGHKTTYNISGWINEGMTYYDDGQSTDIAQLSDNGTTLGSRITFDGTFTPKDSGLTIGFEFITELQTTQTPLLSNQDNISNSNGGGLGLLSNNIHVSGDFGKITVGTQSMPTDNIAVLADPSGTIWSGISPLFRAQGFFIRGTDGDLGSQTNTWGQFAQCLGLNGLGIGIDCNGIYRSGIRYDLPAFGDVKVAVGYANDDIYDIAVQYSGTVNGLTTNVHGGYSYNTDGGLNVGGSSSSTLQFQVGVMDATSGVFGTLAYQQEEADDAIAGSGDDTDAYHVKVGVKRDFNSLGKTAFYVDYASYNDQFGLLNAEGVTGSELSVIGFAAEQNIGSRFLGYAKYEIISLDVDGSAAAQTKFNNAEDLSLLQLGMVVFF